MTDKKNKQLDNSGSTLIVVMVAVSFLVIIASVILAVSSANLRMKQIEYAMKQNFYVSEIGLDDIYNGIGRDVTEAMQRAYSQTLIEANVSGKYSTQNAAYVAFAGMLKNELVSLYGEGDNVAKNETLVKLNSYISRSQSNENLQVMSYQGANIVSDDETGAEMWQYVLKDVKVKYIKDDKYESVITTDIVIEVPYINFFQDFSQFLDYSLIGNKGITFSSTSAFVEGNVYAGIDIKEGTDSNKDSSAAYGGYFYDTKLYDGMNFYQSTVKFTDCSYIVSKGDFNICESAVTIEPKSGGTGKEIQTNLWVENIRTVEKGKAGTPVHKQSITSSTLDAMANIYAADDLELNAGNSRVTLSGNYYGYNYNNSGSSIYTTFENSSIKGKYAVSEKMQAAHTTSSAIVINGMDSVLDLTGLNTLMVAGVAYVDIRDGEKTYSVMPDGEGKELRTGESVAMRYNQFMYLAPSDILKGVSNPQLNGSTDVSEICPTEDNLKLAEWFGQKYLDMSTPVIPIVYKDNEQSYTYYYLNIAEGQEIAYIKDIMTATNPGENGEAVAVQKWELKQEIMKKAGNSGIASHITVKGGSAGSTKVYTTGLLTDTDEEEKTFKKNGIALNDMANRSGNMQKHYAQLYVNLEPNKLDGVDAAKKISTRYPLDNFMNYDKLASGKLPNNFEGREVEGVNKARVWILSGETDPELDLSNKKGIVLCDGDITITGNGVFEGLVIANGKITIKANNLTIKANRGLVQSILEAEQRSVLETEESKIGEIKPENYAAYYFKNTVLVDLSKEKLIDMEKRVTSTEYTDYIYYDNWRKGEASASS